MPLSKASTTVGFSTTGHWEGCVVMSMREANDASAGGRSLTLLRLEGRLSVSSESCACWGASVSHRRNWRAASLRGDAALTIKDVPAPPQRRIGYLSENRGGSIAAKERPGFIPR